MGGRVTKDNSAKLAVLIDADNALHKTIGLVLEEIAKYGKPVVKRVYGDWSSEISENGKLVNRLFVWRDVSLSHAITPVQQFAYTKGKDATDMMLIINAMDLLHDNHLDGFCIVSSDSDFTPLASRIRENGLSVYGFGEKKTPKAFINACDKFIYIENLAETNEEITNEELSEIKERLPKPSDCNEIIVFDRGLSDKKLDLQINIDKTSDKVCKFEPKLANNIPEIKIDEQILQLIYKAIKEIADDDGFANLSILGSYLSTVKPDFDTRNYGRASLSKLLQALDLFEIEQRGSQKYVRKKASFSKFLKVVEQTILDLKGYKEWFFLNPLAIEIKKRNPSLNMDIYGCRNIVEGLKMIDSRYFEFNDNKTQIKLLYPK